MQQSYEKLINSEEFKHNGFLCSFFFMSDMEKPEDKVWQIDFYNKEADKITSYIMDKEIKVNENSEAFKKPETKIEELNINEVKTSFDEAYKKSKNILESKAEEPEKIIALLQKQKVPVWNISFITKKFNILNVRINAANGNIMEEKLISLLSFKEG